MVKCEVCGKEVLAGWICGVVPAPDSLKLGLCPEHDTPQRRIMVRRKWEDMLREKLRQSMDVLRDETERKAQSYVISIHYLDGGVKDVPCSAYKLDVDTQLLVLEENNELDFYPLQHIRRFVVKGAPPAGAEDREPGGATE